MYEFARRWVKRGHKITVVTAPYEKSDIKANSFITKRCIDDINLIIINSPDSNRRSTLIRGFYALRYAIVSTWFSLSISYDVVIASSGPITVGIPALVSRTFRRKKMIFEVRDLWPQGAVELSKISGKLMIKMAYFFEKLCYLNSNLVIPCSTGMEDSIKNRFPQINTLVVPNSCDIELFSPEGFKIPGNSAGRTKIFIYAGSIGLMDDCIQIIKAIQLLKRNDLRYVFIGDGSEKHFLEEISKNNNNITFLGLMSKIEVITWYRKAWASFVTFKNYPVLQTSSPNKMFDSFAAGVPIIQNTQGWIKQLVENEKCGINVPQEDPVRFADAISLLADDETLRNNLASNAFRLARTVFNRDVLALKYLKGIESIQ